MNKPVFVSFYTDNWEYSQMAERLRTQLESMSLKYDIRRMEQSSDWLANTRIKARFIRMMLDIYPAIVWLDADSNIHQVPHMLMDFTEDLLLRPHSTVPGRAWHVSVMAWKSTRQTKALCDAWVNQCDSAGGTDEAAFDAVINRFKGEMCIGCMPLRYHRLPDEAEANAVITIGISRDESKMRLKYQNGFK